MLVYRKHSHVQRMGFLVTGSESATLNNMSYLLQGLSDGERSILLSIISASKMLHRVKYSNITLNIISFKPFPF